MHSADRGNEAQDLDRRGIVFIIIIPDTEAKSVDFIRNFMSKIFERIDSLAKQNMFTARRRDDESCARASELQG